MSEEAILLYSRMKSSSFQGDPYTYSAVLKACAETRDVRVGKAVHCHILRTHLYPSRVVCNSLMNMYATSLDSEMGSVNLVREVFNSMRKRNVVSWNTLISWYVKVGRFVDAAVHFVRMLKAGIIPSVVSFVNVFPAVSGMGETWIGNVLFGMLLKLGSDYFSNSFAVSSAVSMYADLGSLGLSRKVFDSCLNKNMEVWNTMIGGYVQNNCPIEALDLFVEALNVYDGGTLDEVTFLAAIIAASQLQQLNLSKQLHAYIIKNSLVVSIVVLNAVIVMYSRCNSVKTSYEVFRKMNERDVVSWNTMVSAFVQNGMNEEGLMLVYEMQKEGFMIDSITVTALFSAASNLRDQDIGKQTHAYVLRNDIEFEGIESYLIDMYAKSGLIKVAQELFENNSSHDRDQATWNAMVSGNTQNGLIGQAFTVFKKMLELQVPPNAVTIASIIPACNTLGSVVLAKQLHAFTIRKYLHQNVFVSSALVDMYSKLGVIGYAEHVFAQCHEKNSVTYTNMILGYGQHGMGEKALTLFNAMRGCGIQPDSVTIVAVLSACSYAGLVDEGIQIFESMESQYGVSPSIEHYGCVADMLGRVGMVTEAYEFVKQLGEEGNMLGIWGSLLASCRTHGEFELGKVVANKLLETEWGKKGTGYHVLLSNIYAEEGNWENVNRVRKRMQEKGFSKEMGCSWIDVAGNINFFTSRDEKHSQSDEIYEMLEVLNIGLKDSDYRPCLRSNMDLINESEE